MRMRFATTLQQPFAVQDVECTVVGFEPDDMDKDAKVAFDELIDWSGRIRLQLHAQSDLRPH